MRFPGRASASRPAIESGSVVTPYYNSMLAKLITHADTREQALDRLDTGARRHLDLRHHHQSGFLERLIALPATRNATFYTRLIDDHIDELADRTAKLATEALALGAYFWLMRQRHPPLRAPGSPAT